MPIRLRIKSRVKRGLRRIKPRSVKRRLGNLFKRRTRIRRREPTYLIPVPAKTSSVTQGQAPTPPPRVRSTRIRTRKRRRTRKPSIKWIRESQLSKQTY